MFEEEAEEWVKTKGTDAITCLKENIGWDDVCEQAFKDGAEFGYNKANEWHKPSEKLPEECSLVLAYLFEETEPTLCEYVVSNQWECLPRRFVFCSNDQVRLWKEIVLPELEEIKEKDK